MRAQLLREGMHCHGLIAHSAVIQRDGHVCWCRRQLMEQYGFTVAGNPHDRVRFPAAAELLGSRQLRMSHAAVKSAGAAVASAQQRPGGNSSSSVGDARVAAAVTSILQCAGWRNLREFQGVTAEGTRQCAVALLAWVQRQQQSAATSAAQDRCLLQTAGSARLEAAVRYRLERKELLQTAADILDRVASPG